MTAEVYHGMIISSSQMWKEKPVMHVLHLALEMKCQLPKPCSFTWPFVRPTTFFWPVLLPTLVLCQISWLYQNRLKGPCSSDKTPVECELLFQCSQDTGAQHSVKCHLQRLKKSASFKMYCTTLTKQELQTSSKTPLQQQNSCVLQNHTTSLYTYLCTSASPCITMRPVLDEVSQAATLAATSCEPATFYLSCTKCMYDFWICVICIIHVIHCHSMSCISMWLIQ